VLQGLSLKRPLEIGRSMQGLYVLDAVVAKDLETAERNEDSHRPYMDKREASKDLFSFSCNNETVNLWHRRMGHISFRKLSYMSVLKDFNFNKDPCSFPCDICPCAKQHKLPQNITYPRRRDSTNRLQPGLDNILYTID